MTKKPFEGAEIGIPCPKCGHKTKKSIAWLRTHREMTCSGCGGTITLEADKLLAGVDKVGKSIEDFRRKIRKLNKPK